MDFTSDQTQINTQSTVLHCMKEVAPYPGCSIRDDGTTIKVDCYGGSKTIIKKDSHKLVITHTKNSNAIKIYRDDNMVGEDIPTTIPYASISQTTILGAYQTITGTKNRYWNGTINKFNVWFRTLTTEEINALLV